MKKKAPEGVVAQAVDSYLRGKETYEQISARTGKSVRTIQSWVAQWKRVIVSTRLVASKDDEPAPKPEPPPPPPKETEKPVEKKPTTKLVVEETESEDDDL